MAAGNREMGQGVFISSMYSETGKDTPYVYNEVVTNKCIECSG